MTVGHNVERWYQVPSGLKVKHVSNHNDQGSFDKKSSEQRTNMTCQPSISFPSFHPVFLPTHRPISWFAGDRLIDPKHRLGLWLNRETTERERRRPWHVDTIVQRRRLLIVFRMIGTTPRRKPDFARGESRVKS